MADRPDPRLLKDAKEFLDDLVTNDAVRDSEHPHDVVAFDPETGIYSVRGPYPDEREATISAVQWAAELNRDMPEGEVPFQTHTAMHYDPAGREPHDCPRP